MPAAPARTDSRRLSRNASSDTVLAPREIRLDDARSDLGGGSSGMSSGKGIVGGPSRFAGGIGHDEDRYSERLSRIGDATRVRDHSVLLACTEGDVDRDHVSPDRDRLFDRGTEDLRCRAGTKEGAGREMHDQAPFRRDVL